MIKNLGRVTGKSAYELWLDAGNEGSLEDFFAYLQSGISVDDEVTAQSDNPVKSCSIYAYANQMRGELAENIAALSSELEGKVDKATGKGLSTNDFANDLKYKLEMMTVYRDADISALALAVLRQYTDDSITAGGRNPVAGSAIKSYVDTLAETARITIMQEIANLQITVDSIVDESSVNPVQNQAIKAYVDTAIANATAAFINGDEVSY